MVVSTPDEIASWAKDSVLFNNNGAVLRRLDDGVCADSNPVLNIDRAFFTGNHRVVSKNDVVANAYCSLFRVSSIKQDTFA